MTRPGDRSMPFISNQRHNSTSMPQGDFGLSDARHPRIDTLAHPSQGNLHGQMSALDTSSPNSTDLNFAFAASPHTSISSGFEPPIDRMGGTMNGRNSMSSLVTVPGSLPLSSQHRGSFNRISMSGYPASIGNDYMSNDQWSPINNQAQPHISNQSEESLTKVESNGSNPVRRETDNQNDGEDAEKPPWSDLKTKAGRERKRLPLACIACRRKKIKCSGEKPACKHCLRSRIPCVYKVTARKAAPRTDYMAMLDKRLKRMEERVIKIIPKDDLPDLNVTGRSSVRPPVPGQTPKPARPSVHKKRSADEAFVLELQEWTQSRNQASGPNAVSNLEHQKEGENKLYIEGQDSLPPIHIQEHLAEVFFDCIYGQSYLLLHKPSFMRKLKTGSVPPVLILAVCAISARFSTHPQVGGDPAFLRGNGWATAARTIVEKRHYEPNMTILTVMLILGLHYFGTCEGGLSWSFGGQAMRMAYALQLHRELDHDPLGRKNGKASQLSFTDREIRRRTMWACFLMDTFNSSGTERPSFGNEDYMHIQLPIKESHFQMEVPGPTEDLDGDVPNTISPGQGLSSDPRDNMGVAAYVIRAVVLWKRIVKYLNLGGKERDPHPLWDPLSQFADLRRQIARLKENLPASLRYTEENLQNHAAERVANQFLYLHIIHAQNALFLNRFAIPTSPAARPPKDMPKQFLSDAARDVVESAAQISALIEEASAHMLTVPFAGYCAYASSTVHVWGIFSKNDNLEATSKENLRHNYKYLNRMKRYWGMFHYMTESVKEIYRHFADASVKGHQPHLSTSSGEISRAGTPNPNASEMFQYGNWFDKYPLGVSETEWEDEHRGYKKEAGQGAEAVMSQRSDLQSVEEFFASLSPPSKAEQQQAQARKIARRRGKSIAESKKAQSVNSNDQSNTTPPQPQVRNINNWQGDSIPTLQQSQSLNAEYMDATSSAQLYSQAQQPDISYQPNPMDFHPSHTGMFNFANALPQLDRQMVFGAYAGLDAASSAGIGGLNNLNMWEGLDLSGIEGLSNENNGPSASGPGGNGGAGAPPAASYMGASEMAVGGSAWFIPFNMEPPTWGSEFDGLSVGGADMPGIDAASFGGMSPEEVRRGSHTAQKGGVNG